MSEEKKVAVQAANGEPEVQFSGSYNFQHPLEFEGQAYSEVKYDLTRLRGIDLVACQAAANRLRHTGESETMMTDSLLHAVIFARSADLPEQFVLELSAADFAAWQVVSQSFLASGLSCVIR